MTDANVLPTWTTDFQGRRLRIGLTFDETETFERYLAEGRDGVTAVVEAEVFWELRNKHEFARRRASSVTDPVAAPDPA